MTFGEILSAAKNRIGRDHLFYSLFEKHFADEVDKIPGNPRNWRDRSDFVTVNNIACFFSCVLNTLFMLATSFANTPDDSVYRDATQIAETIRLVLQENFNVTIDPHEIMSPTRMMENHGLLKVVIKSGKQFVQLTDAGRYMANQFMQQNNPAANPANPSSN